MSRIEVKVQENGHTLKVSYLSAILRSLYISIWCYLTLHIKGNYIFDIYSLWLFKMFDTKSVINYTTQLKSAPLQQATIKLLINTALIISQHYNDEKKPFPCIIVLKVHLNVNTIHFKKNEYRTFNTSLTPKKLQMEYKNKTYREQHNKIFWGENTLPVWSKTLGILFRKLPPGSS